MFVRGELRGGEAISGGWKYGWDCVVIFGW